MPWPIHDVVLVPSSAGVDPPGRHVVFEIPTQQQLALSGIPIDKIRDLLPAEINATSKNNVGLEIRKILEAGGIALLPDPADTFIYVDQGNGFHAVIRWPQVQGHPYVYTGARTSVFVAVAVIGPRFEDET